MEVLYTRQSFTSVLKDFSGIKLYRETNILQWKIQHGVISERQTTFRRQLFSLYLFLHQAVHIYELLIFIISVLYMFNGLCLLL